jgi:hypothetical protein
MQMMIIDQMLDLFLFHQLMAILNVLNVFASAGIET